MKRLVVVLILMLGACSRHDDVPPPLDVTVPPTPQDLVVETVDFITFTLTWNVSDPSIVREYRLYWRFESTSPELLPETVDTTAVSISVDPPIPAPGIIFCVSSVTLENVESSLVCDAAEETPSMAASVAAAGSVPHLTIQE